MGALLVVKKSADVLIENEIGRIFRGHNIIEFKSPNDELNLDVYMKVLAYAYLYKAHEKHMNEIMPEDITITFVRESYPRELLSGSVIIIMLWKNHLFLTSITRKMNKEDAECLAKP